MTRYYQPTGTPSCESNTASRGAAHQAACFSRRTALTSAFRIKRTRVLALTLLIVVVFGMLSSLFILAVSGCHTCLPKGCPFCTQMTLAARYLEKLFSAVSYSGIAPLVFFSVSSAVLLDLVNSRMRNTLVTLCVKLTD